MANASILTWSMVIKITRNGPRLGQIISRRRHIQCNYHIRHYYIRRATGIIMVNYNEIIIIYEKAAIDSMFSPAKYKAFILTALPMPAGRHALAGELRRPLLHEHYTTENTHHLASRPVMEKLKTRRRLRIQITDCTQLRHAHNGLSEYRYSLLSLFYSPYILILNKVTYIIYFHLPILALLRCDDV